MIRVTTSQLHRSSFRAVNEARARTQDAQQVAMTGKRVVTAADDPAAAARARVMGQLQSAAESHLTNTTYGTARLQAAEDALSEISNQLLRLREISLASANETLSADQRQAYGVEVGQIRDTVIDLMNTKHLGEYVFSPVDSRTPVYDASASAFTYDVDAYSTVRKAEVGPNQLAEIGSSASHAFAARAANPNSLDVPAVMGALETALLANDITALRATVDPLQAAFEQVVSERTRTGVRVQRLQGAEDAATQAISVYKSLQSDLIDADAGQAFTNLAVTETAMQAAISVAARMLGPSLLDVM